jgi:hypothetical protein
MGFLNPSTVYSSNKLARRISYEHHLWGSNVKELGDGLRARARAQRSARFIQRQSSIGTEHKGHAGDRSHLLTETSTAQNFSAF